MQLRFSPAIGETTAIAVPPSQVRNAGWSQTLLFRATFDSRDSYDKACVDGIAVEMWTDLPVDGRAKGEWGALGFSKVRPEVKHEPGSSQTSLSLLAPEDEGTHEREENTFYAEVPIRFDDCATTEFSFTYRLVYPSGEIKWLGEFGHNGVLIITQGLHGISLSNGWHVRDGAYVLEKDASEDVEVVGQLNTELGWSSWSFKEDSWPTLSRSFRTSSSLSIILLPRARGPAIYEPQPLVLASSPGSSISISPSGKVFYSAADSSARLSLRALDGSSNLLKSLMDPALEGVHSLMAVEPPYALVASPAPDASVPVCLSIIPLSSHVAPTTDVNLSLRTLASFLPEDTHAHFAMFCRSLKRSRICKVSAESDDHVGLRVGRAGGQLILSPISTVLSKRSGEERVWDICMVSAHKSAVVVLEEKEHVDHLQRALPTPPPSPPPVHPADHTREHAPAPLPSSEEVDDARSPAHSASSIPSAHPSQRDTAVARHPPLHLRAYAHVVANLIAWFWRVLFAHIVGRTVSRSRTRGVSSVGEERWRTVYGGQSTTEPSAERQDTVQEQEQEQERLEHTSGTSGRGSDLNGDTPAVTAVDSTAVAEARSNLAPVIPTPHVPSPLLAGFQGRLAPAQPTAPFFSADVLGQPIAFLVHIADREQHVKDLEISLDGKPTSASSIVKLCDDNTYLVELPADEGEARLVVAFSK
ncbi:hypothetical protein A0H81_00506 [Grifola frondosa]|uniref:Uncharacterized protein n=1 Tax=Grifola frondosa TaxID=5627 RepID=A0A1C7MTL4_GRIFR|nr:hypothetical protein A0H81_00506 [Grifola frondosa]